MYKANKGGVVVFSITNSPIFVVYMWYRTCVKLIKVLVHDYA